MLPTRKIRFLPHLANPAAGALLLSGIKQEKKEHESGKYWLQLKPRKQATPLHLAIVKIVVETRNATDLAHGLLE